MTIRHFILSALAGAATFDAPAKVPCVDNPHLFDPPGEHSRITNAIREAIRERHQAAVALCQSCPALTACAAWETTRSTIERAQMVAGGRLPDISQPRTYALCTVDGCDRRRHARGLCSVHYHRLMQSGTVQRGKPVADRGGQPRTVAAVEKLLDEGLDAETILAELGITAHAVYTAYNRQRRPLPDEFREAHAAYKASRRCAS